MSAPTNSFVPLTLLDTSQTAYVNVRNIAYLIEDDSHSPAYIEIYFNFQDQNGGAYSIKVSKDSGTLASISDAGY